jgi:hypothetical protein
MLGVSSRMAFLIRVSLVISHMAWISDDLLVWTGRLGDAAGLRRRLAARPRPLVLLKEGRMLFPETIIFRVCIAHCTCQIAICIANAIDFASLAKCYADNVNFR